MLVLDIALPGQDGLNVLRSLRQRWPELPVLTSVSGGMASERADTKW